jgi:hypothetical protein
MVTHEQFVDKLKRQHSESIEHLEKIVQIHVEDKALKDKHIAQLNGDVEKLKADLIIMEKRLDR